MLPPRISSAGGSEEGRTRDVAITQDSEPSALPTELFRPRGDRYSKLNLKLFSVASRKTVEADPLIR